MFKYFFLIGFLIGIIIGSLIAKQFTMIEFEKDMEQMTMECDQCSYASTFDGTWSECIAEAKEDGWRIVKVGEEWRHYCDDCKYDT